MKAAYPHPRKDYCRFSTPRIRVRHARRSAAFPILAKRTKACTHKSGLFGDRFPVSPLLPIATG